LCVSSPLAFLSPFEDYATRSPRSRGLPIQTFCRFAQSIASFAGLLTAKLLPVFFSDQSFHFSVQKFSFFDLRQAPPVFLSPLIFLPEIALLFLELSVKLFPSRNENCPFFSHPFSGFILLLWRSSGFKEWACFNSAIFPFSLPLLFRFFPGMGKNVVFRGKKFFTFFLSSREIDFFMSPFPNFALMTTPILFGSPPSIGGQFFWRGDFTSFFFAPPPFRFVGIHSLQPFCPAGCRFLPSSPPRLA